MSESSKAQIGCVRYLNSKPLIHGHGDTVSFEVPASLADGLRSGRLDAALSPIFELIAQPGYRVVDDVAIACRGAVFSVFVAYAGKLEEMRTLYLDSDSRTSFHLQRVVLAEFYGLMPKCVSVEGGKPPEVLREGEGALVIGDPAIEFRLRHGGRYQYFDLGEEWGKATGLPFVFAAWLVRADVPEKEARELAERLRGWRTEGERCVEEIVAAEGRYPAEVSRKYLTEFIRYGLGEEEKRAVREFARLLRKYELVEAEFVEPQWCKRKDEGRKQRAEGLTTEDTKDTETEEGEAAWEAAVEGGGGEKNPFAWGGECELHCEIQFFYPPVLTFLCKRLIPPRAKSS